MAIIFFEYDRSPVSTRPIPVQRRPRGPAFLEPARGSAGFPTLFVLALPITLCADADIRHRGPAIGIVTTAPSGLGQRFDPVWPAPFPVDPGPSEAK